MSLTAESMTPADIAACTGGGNCNNGMWGGDWSSWIILFLIFGMFGWGGFGGWGGGFGGGGAAGASENYVLASDFATIQRQLSDGFGGVEKGLDTIRNGLCDGFYTQAQLVNGLNQGLAQQGYETRNAITQAQIAQMQSANALQAQLAQCCCDNRAAIADVNYNLATQANGIGRQLERGFADTNYNMATQNCATLQAIDKVGDRVIDYLANKENQNLRDEVQALRLAASQQAQNAYLINQLSPKCPEPAYLVCNPNTPVNYGNGCGCA